MKYLDEFNDPELARTLFDEIARITRVAFQAAGGSDVIAAIALHLARRSRASAIKSCVIAPSSI